MTRRPELGRAGAGLLTAMAAASLVLASSAGDPGPVRAQPLHLPARPAALSLREAAPSPPRPFVPRAMIPPGRPALRVPILMYHYIRVNPDPRDRLGFNLSVTPEDLTRQMDWLAANGYEPVDFDDLRGYVLGRHALPARPVVLTFDDGYRDMYTTAFPILRAHHFKAVSYVVTGFVNSPGNVTSEQVREMDAYGIQIGAHTVSHVDLTAISPGELHRQVYDSKASLEALVGHPVLDFCYPSGRYDDAVIREVQAAGFQTATTTQPGVAHSAADRFLWTRVRVSGGESLAQFVADLGSPEPTELVPMPKVPPPGLQGRARLPVTIPLLPPREALPAAPPSAGPFP